MCGIKTYDEGIKWIISDLNEILILKIMTLKLRKDEEANDIFCQEGMENKGKVEVE